MEKESINKIETAGVGGSYEFAKRDYLRRRDFKENLKKMYLKDNLYGNIEMPEEDNFFQVS